MRSSLFTISKGSVQLTNISIICTWKQKEPRPFSQQSSMSPLTGDRHRLFTWVKQFTSLQVHLCHSQYIIINIHTLKGWKTFLWPTNLKVETDYQTICATQILISPKAENYLPIVKSLNLLAKKTISSSLFSERGRDLRYL